MEDRKVYVVMENHWQYNFGESDYSDEWIDSIWSKKEDALRRIDDLANEFIRKTWYESGADLDDFYCDINRNHDNTIVQCTDDYMKYQKTTYFINEIVIDPVLADFTGF